MLGASEITQLLFEPPNKWHNVIARTPNKLDIFRDFFRAMATGRLSMALVAVGEVTPWISARRST
jgi:hypothetical protein